MARGEGLAILSRLWIVLGSLLFSTGGAAVKLVDLNAAQITCARSAIAALVLVAVSGEARRGLAAVRSRAFLRLLAVGAAFATTMLLFVAANRTTTAANAVFLQSTAPLYVLLLGPLLLHEPLIRRDLVTLVVVALGMMLFFLAPGEQQVTAPDPLLGNALATAAGLTWALTVVGLRSLARAGQGPLGAVAVGSILAMLITLPFAWPLEVSVSDGLVLGWLGAFQIALAYVFVTAGLRGVPAFEASILFLIEPVFNPLWAWFVHAERPEPLALLGGVVILGAGLLSARRAGARSPARASPRGPAS